MEPRKSNLIFETEEDEFINPPRRGRTSTSSYKPSIVAGMAGAGVANPQEPETTKPTMSYDEWLETKRPEEDFIDFESPTSKAVMASTRGEDWKSEDPQLAMLVEQKEESDKRAGQPSALQKKYEEMGLEYDYTKRQQAEEDKSSINEYRRVIEQENPDFLKRNDASDMVEDISEQLKNQYDKEMGRLNAIEVSIIANPKYSGTEYARGDMQLLRLRQQQIKDFYEAEKAKLDGQYYESLPPKDMNVANMLLGQGITGNQLTYLTKNHGNIRDTINENLLYIPEDKKEEFKTKLFGDYVRDDQGNIVRNALGEELRKGGELITVTPQGTYDYTISPTAFSNGITRLLKQPEFSTQAETNREVELEKRVKGISDSLTRARNPDNAALYDQEYVSELEKELSRLDKELSDLRLNKARDFISETETFTNEQEVAQEETQEEVTGNIPKSETDFAEFIGGLTNPVGKAEEIVYGAFGKEKPKPETPTPKATTQTQATEQKAPTKTNVTTAPKDRQLQRAINLGQIKQDKNGQYVALNAEGEETLKILKRNKVI